MSAITTQPVSQSCGRRPGGNLHGRRQRFAPTQLPVVPEPGPGRQRSAEHLHHARPHSPGTSKRLRRRQQSAQPGAIRHRDADRRRGSPGQHHHQPAEPDRRRATSLRSSPRPSRVPHPTPTSGTSRPKAAVTIDPRWRHHQLHHHHLYRPCHEYRTVGAYTLTVNNAANAPATSAAAQLTLAPPGHQPRAQPHCDRQQLRSNPAPTKPRRLRSAASTASARKTRRRQPQQPLGVAVRRPAPPATTVAGVDPSWLQVDLGSVQPFNTVILNWENAYAAQYKIQYTNADPATNPVWQDMTPTRQRRAGNLGRHQRCRRYTETLDFSTVQARWVRLLAITARHAVRLLAV